MALLAIKVFWSTVFNSLFFLPPGSALQSEAARPRFPALASSYDLRTYQGVNLRERCVELMAEVPPESLGRNSVRADAAGYRIVGDSASRHGLDGISVRLGRFV